MSNKNIVRDRKQQALYYLRQITSFKDRACKRDEEVFVISKEWLNKWKLYVDYEFAKRKYIPLRGDRSIKLKDAVDLTPIYDENNIIKNIKDNQSQNVFFDKTRHFQIKIIPKEVMAFFKSSFNIKGKKIIRKKEYDDIPMYPIYSKINFIWNFTPVIKPNKGYLHIKEIQPMNYFYNQTIKNYLDTLSSSYKTNNSFTSWKCKLENEKEKIYIKEFISSDTLLTSISLKDEILLIEDMNKPSKEITLNDNMKQLARGRKGMVGFNNLGNTCYMASGLQCLSNCDYLAEYFLKYYNESQINKVNKAGTYGYLTNAFQAVVGNLWKENNNSYAPNEFKQEIGKFNSTFAGYSQQDSYELVSFSLEGMSEDLNRVLNPEKFKKNLPDEFDDDKVWALYVWEKFRNQSDSIIIDLFYGMYKNVIYCPQGCISRVFEHFQAFQLSINVLYITCVFVYYDLSIQPIEIKIPFESDKKYGHLRREISEIFDVNEDSFVFANVDDHGKIIQLNNTERQVQSNAVVYCYQIDPQITKDPAKTQSLKYKPKDEIETIMKKIFSCLEYRERKIVTFNSSQVNRDKIRQEIDNHYNLDDKYVILILNINVPYQKKTPIQRLLFVDRTMTLTQLNEYIKSYLSPLSTDLSKSITIFANNSLMNNLSTNTQPTSKESSFISDYPIHNPSKSEIDNGLSSYNNSNSSLKMTLSINGLNPLHIEFESEKSYDLSKYLYIQLSHLFKVKHPFEINAYLYIDKADRCYIDETQYNSFQIDVFDVDSKSTCSFEPERLTLPHDGNAFHLEYCIKQSNTITDIIGSSKCISCQQFFPNIRKSISVYSCSNYLIIQFKRFNNDMTHKLNTLITFPINGFDISPYFAEKGTNMVYDLIGVINHYGSFYGGHYTAYAKNCVDGKWREFNDSHVSLINESDVITTAAYALFYKRRHIKDETDLEELFKKTLNK